jgi:N-ethylmaleimide reductase
LRDGTNKRTDAYGGSIENRTRFLLEVVDAVTAVVGAERTGVRISPQNGQNDITDSDPQNLFNHVAAALSGRGLAYLHVIEGDTGGVPVPPFDYLAIKRLFGGIFIANNAFGKPFISNPDLVTRLYLEASLSPLHRETLYGGAEQGYTDYPVLRAVVAHACYADAERAWG